MTHRTSDPGETETLGAQVARALEPGDVVLVSGELGSGKTTFVRGAARALGVSGPVTSPTFTIGRRYTAGALKVSHLDLYRLESLASEDPALLEDYVTPDSVSFVEWPAVLEQGFAPPALEGVRIAVRVELLHAGGDDREVTIEEAD